MYLNIGYRPECCTCFSTARQPLVNAVHPQRVNVYKDNTNVQLYAGNTCCFPLVFRETNTNNGLICCQLVSLSALYRSSILFALCAMTRRYQLILIMLPRNETILE